MGAAQAALSCRPRTKTAAFSGTEAVIRHFPAALRTRLQVEIGESLKWLKSLIRMALPKAKGVHLSQK
jgi:hypothetical protein